MSLNTAETIAKDLQPFIGRFWGDGIGTKLMYDKIFNVEAKKAKFVDLQQLTGLGIGSAVTDGGPIKYANFVQNANTRIVQGGIALGFQISLQQQVFAQTLDLMKMGMRDLKLALEREKEIIHANVLNNGFTNSSPYLGGDGVPLFSTSHPTLGGNVSNTASVATTWSESAVETAIIAIKNILSQDGTRMDLDVKAAVVPTSLTFEAARLLRNIDRPATADRDINAIVHNKALPDYMVWNYLKYSTAAWFLLTELDDPNTGLVSYSAMPPKPEVFGDGDTRNIKCTLMEIYGAGWGDYRAIYGNAGT
jgi:hypothetical protein